MRDNEGLPTLQRITNRYIASMTLHDEIDEMQVEEAFSSATGVIREFESPRQPSEFVFRPWPFDTTDVQFRASELMANYTFSLIVDGSWKQRVNLTMCFLNEQKSPSTVTIDIRDHGTGNRGETQLKFDPMASLFDIIPLRPSFNTKTKNILFLFIKFVINLILLDHLKFLSSYNIASKRDKDKQRNSIIMFGSETTLDLIFLLKRI
uniref:Uncharacterized protein n=1 Tax=Heterorhabditis bacteriophora TaxID=37862 RepID=A0A1I7W6T4_HETBA